MSMIWDGMELATVGPPIAARRLKMAFAAAWKRARQVVKPSPKRLRLCESLPLGERRLVAVIEFEGKRFLLGATANSVVLLSKLGESQHFAPGFHPEDLHPEDRRSEGRHPGGFANVALQPDRVGKAQQEPAC